jgi:hypothetical protein
MVDLSSPSASFAATKPSARPLFRPGTSLDGCGVLTQSPPIEHRLRRIQSADDTEHLARASRGSGRPVRPLNEPLEVAAKGRRVVGEQPIGPKRARLSGGRTQLRLDVLPLDRTRLSEVKHHRLLSRQIWGMPPRTAPVGSNGPTSRQATGPGAPCAGDRASVKDRPGNCDLGPWCHTVCERTLDRSGGSFERGIPETGGLPVVPDRVPSTAG